MKSPRRDHSKLAPVLCDFIPEGRDATSKAAYLVMRRIARLNRQEIYDSAVDSVRNLVLYGTSIAKLKLNA